VVDVAHGGWSGAADDGAAEVAGGQRPALCRGDFVRERLQALDLAEVVEQQPADPGVAQESLDPFAGLRPGPGGDGAGVLGRHHACAS
jgi:hypothetical protein